MSSRKSYIRESFASAMRKQEGSAASGTPITTQHIEPPSESTPGPSHPAFNRLEEMKAKQLKEVRTRPF